MHVASNDKGLVICTVRATTLTIMMMIIIISVRSEGKA